MFNFKNAVGNLGKRTWGKQLMLGVVGLGLAVGLSGSAAQAQSKMQVFGGYAYGGANSLAEDYCYYICAPSTPRQGFSASFAYNFSPHIGLEASFDGFNGTETPASQTPGTEDNGYSEKDKGSSYFYTFGPRLTYPVGDFSLYTHFLVGGTHVHDNITDTCTPATEEEEDCGSPNPETQTDSGNGMAFKVGGGVDWNHGVWGIRVIELNYVHSQISASGSNNIPYYAPTYSINAPSNTFQVAAGVTINFGGPR
jgi:hypothetical protein